MSRALDMKNEFDEWSLRYVSGAQLWGMDWCFRWYAKMLISAYWYLNKRQVIQSSNLGVEAVRLRGCAEDGVTGFALLTWSRRSPAACFPPFTYRTFVAISRTSAGGHVAVQEHCLRVKINMDRTVGLTNRSRSPVVRYHWELGHSRPKLRWGCHPRFPFPHFRLYGMYS